MTCAQGDSPRVQSAHNDTMLNVHSRVGEMFKGNL
jgi:hypothetical protein